MMIVMIQKAGVYMFDEPTSYLDVKQRIKMAKLIRSIQTHNNYIIVV
jgi:ATP-binding cassette subfamily E protein 1